MAVLIGSARLGENGRITGGQAGDQTGKEVSTQNWYLHSKGWRAFRANDASKRKKIAYAMKAACANNRIGYDQNSRNSLYSLASKVGFDPAKVTAVCETDCSALVRVCCAYAGINVNDFITSNEANVLMASGAFTELSGDKYTTKSDYLATGDILVTKTKGHTVVVLSDGAKAEDNTEPKKYMLGDRTLKNGSEGDDVKELQAYLIQLGYDCGRWGADGEFGDATEIAVKAFQKDHKCEVDGIVGAETVKALNAAFGSSDGESTKARYVVIVGGNCYIRTAPNKSGDILGVAHAGDRFEYQGVNSADGWHLVIYKNQNAWVSGKYSKLED